MFTDGLIANTRKQHRSSTAGSLGRIYHLLEWPTANPTTQFTCGLPYDGETVESYNKRRNSHRSDIKCKPDLPLIKQSECRSFVKSHQNN